MKSKWSLFLLLLAGQCTGSNLIAQATHDLTIVYDITVNKNSKSSGIEETYNGGTKAFFISNNKARMRLVSLMRIESIFFNFDSTLKEVRVIKESGTKKYQYILNAADWKDFNGKYAGATYTTLSDTMNIAGYPCKKAILHLTSGEKITIYYTNSLFNKNKFIDPAFSSIPGTVLQYEYTSLQGYVRFKASEVKKGSISKDVFEPPVTGITTRKYSPKEKD